MKPTTSRTTVLAIVAACLAAATVFTPRASAGDAPPPYMNGVDTVRADGELVWNVDYQIVNTLDTGFFPDSFRVDFENADDVRMRGERRWRENIDALAKGILPVSGHDSLQASYFCPARFEHGRLTLVLYGHTTTGTVPPLSHTVELRPGPFETSYPSALLESAKGKVEFTLLPPGNPEGRAPAILIVHDELGHGRTALPVARMLSLRGYAVALVSMPGFGRSSGEADWCGPATAAALEAAWAKLRATPGVDPARLAVWGSGRGATAAALLAARHPEVAALVAQSGTYDLAAAVTAADAPTRASIAAEAGKDAAALRARTVLRQPIPKCAVLLVHGELDTTAPAAAAHAYEAALRKAGAKVETRWFADRGHDAPQAAVRSAAMAFLRKLFGN